MERSVFLEQGYIDIINKYKRENPGYLKGHLIEFLMNEFYMDMNKAIATVLYLEEHPGGH